MVGRHRRPSTRRFSRFGMAAALGVGPRRRLAGPASAADFPAKDSALPQLRRDGGRDQAVAAAHPDIVEVQSIGKSYQGRDIWAAKISDNVATDEDEPEILFDALHHAREHMTVEQALYLLHLLADNYGSDATVTNLVNGREVWIIFALNPDGGEYDLTCRRAPRRPTAPGARTASRTPGRRRSGPTSTATTTIAGAAAAARPATRPRSRTAGSAAVLRARDARPARLRQQPGDRTGSSRSAPTSRFHTNGKLILWPYGYTKTNIPSDMSRRGPQRVRGDGQGDGRAERLQGRAVERSLHHRRRPDRLDVRRPPDLLVHLGALPARDVDRLGRPLPGRRDRSPRRPPATGAPCSTSSTSAAARTARSAKDEDALAAPSTTTSRSPAAGPVESRTARTRRQGRLGPRQRSGGSTSSAATRSSSGRPRPARRRWSPGGRPGPTPTSTTSTAGRRRSGRSRSSCRATVGSLTFRYYFAHGSNSSSDDSFRVWVEAGGDAHGASSASSAPASSSAASGRRAALPLTSVGRPDGPDRVHGDRRRRRTAWSRRASTTSGSSDPDHRARVATTRGFRSRGTPPREVGARRAPARTRQVRPSQEIDRCGDSASSSRPRCWASS